jgi:hypothetical protein
VGRKYFGMVPFGGYLSCLVCMFLVVVYSIWERGLDRSCQAQLEA